MIPLGTMQLVSFPHKELPKAFLLLRIPDSYHAKTLKKHTPLVRFALYFHNQAIFQKSERSFFDQVAIDAKSALTFENRPLVAELKLKMSQNGRFFMF